MVLLVGQKVLTLVNLQMVMQTATPGGRPSGSRSAAAGSSSNGSSSAGDVLESLEQLSTTALLQLFKLADATQQIAALFQLLPLEDGTFPNGGGAAAAGQSDTAAAEGMTTTAALCSRVAAAVLPRLPQLQLCVERLMQNSCFKEAHTCVECLLLLGKRLGSISGLLQPQHQPGDPGPEHTATAAASGVAATADVPAYACLSTWAEAALQQEEPEVKHVALARTLLDMYIRFHGMVLKATHANVLDVWSLFWVGDNESVPGSGFLACLNFPRLVSGTRAISRCWQTGVLAHQKLFVGLVSTDTYYHFV